MRLLSLSLCFVFAVISLDAVWKQCSAATYDATGTWNWSDTSNNVNPGTAGCDAEILETGTVDIIQSGDSFTVTVHAPLWPDVVSTGTVSGANYAVSASFDEDGGTTNETVNFTLSSLTSGSCSSTWTWSVFVTSFS